MVSTNLNPNLWTKFSLLNDYHNENQKIGVKNYV